MNVPPELPPAQPGGRSRLECYTTPPKCATLAVMLNAPIDNTHAEQIAFTNQLRRRLRLVQQQVEQWEPRPCPNRDLDIYNGTRP